MPQTPIKDYKFVPPQNEIASLHLWAVLYFNSHRNDLVIELTSSFLLSDEKQWIDLEEANMQFFMYTIIVMVYQFLL